MNLFTKLLSTLCLICLSYQTLAADFPDSDLDKLVKKIRHHYPALPQDWVLAQIQQAQFAKRTIELINNPSEKKLNWTQYRNIFIQPKRINAGIRFYNNNKHYFIEAEQLYKVNRWTILSILGVETYYGRILGKTAVLDALVTLSIHPESKRQAFFSAQLADFLLLVKRGKLNLNAIGSYAGAIGMGQFIPTSIRRWGVDGSNDGSIDLVTNKKDAIFSVANYFQKHGWKEGEPIAKRSTPAHGERFETDDGEEWWQLHHNFAVIKRYNPSNLYALAVYQLSQELKMAAINHE